MKISIIIPVYNAIPYLSKCLNSLFDFNPTAENMAKWICDKVTDICETGYCYKVEVQESEGNVAIYERGEDPE